MSVYWLFICFVTLLLYFKKALYELIFNLLVCAYNGIFNLLVGANNATLYTLEVSTTFSSIFVFLGLNFSIMLICLECISDA